MHRYVVVLMSILILSHARSEVRFAGGAHAGIGFSSFPQGVSDFYGTGFLFGAHGDVDIMKYVGMRLNVDYSIYASNKDKLKQGFSVTDPNGNPITDYTISGLNVNAFSITANGLGKIPTGSVVTPYGLFGLGIHILSISDGKLEVQGQSLDIKTGLGSQTKFGLNFGAGAEFALHPVKLFFDFKYVLILTEGSSTGLIPLTVGVSFGG